MKGPEKAAREGQMNVAHFCSHCHIKFNLLIL